MSRAISDACETVESIFNIVGYIPVLGTLSGYIRIHLGFFQMWAGLIVALVSVLMSWLQFGERKEHRQAWHERVGSGLLHAVHGLLNIGRGIIELIPFLPLITCLPYDRSESKILSYDTD